MLIPKPIRILLRSLMGLPKRFLITMPRTVREYFEIKSKEQNKYQLSDFKNGFKDSIILPDNEYYVNDFNLDRIISAYLKSKQDQVGQPIAYQIGGEWEGLINHIYGELLTQIENKQFDCVRRTLSNFAKDKISMGLSAYGTIANGFFTSLEFLNYYNNSYNIWKSLTGLSDDSLVYPKIGNIHGIEEGEGVISWTSFRLSYFAQRITSLLSEKTAQSKKTVLEVGGGYGGIPFFLFQKFNFSNNKYMNLDIPENNMVVSFFLMSAFPKKEIFLYGESLPNNDYDIAIMPNYYLKHIPANYTDLVFNSHSLTEMSQETVKEYLKQIDRISSKYFFHANHEGNPDDYDIEHKHVNLNDPAFELPKSAWKRIYRLPETLTNISCKNKITTFTFWEYLYEKY